METFIRLCKVCDKSYEWHSKRGNNKADRVICPGCRETHQRCSVCLQAKLKSDFAPRKDGKATGYCRFCMAIYKGTFGIYECSHCHVEWMLSRGHRYNGFTKWFCPECIETHKYCKQCDTTKPVDQFYKRSDARGGRTAHCIACIKIKTDTAAEGLKLKKYGLTVADYQALLAEQDGKCFICLMPETNVDSRTGRVTALAVDHCHATGRNRKLLCQRCNQALGLMRDDPAMIRRAAEYLDHFRVTS